jgi:hypothetical protein
MQVKRCKTDTVDGLAFDDPDRPECANLLALYQVALLLAVSKYLCVRSGGQLGRRRARFVAAATTSHDGLFVYLFHS